MISPDTVAERVAAVRERIAAAGGERVRLIGVTKGLGADAVRAAAAAGLQDLGENYAQELLAKAVVDDGVRWHFIGQVQRNKVRRIASLVDTWHSVDRIEVGREIVRRRPGARVLVQVNVSGEGTKAGCAPGAAAPLVDELRTLDLEVVGLMGVGRMGEPEAARPGFRLLRQMADEMELTELSMGMSADLEVAVSEGATMVRVGTGIFGPRPRRAATAGRSDERSA